MRSIAILNQKGGVGKTTSTVNIGAGLAERGQRVLLIDMDPQAHLTLHLGLEPSELEFSVYDVLTAGLPLDKILVHRSATLDIAPSHINLAGAEIELVNTIGREGLLRDAIAACQAPYDYVLIDCPPSLGMLSLNALVACDEVFVPLQTQFLAMQGMSQLLETTQLVNRRLNPRLRVSGIIFCQYDRRTSLSREVVEEVRGHFTPKANAGGRLGPTVGGRSAGESAAHKGPTVFETHIRQTIRLAEAPSFGKSIFEYDRASPGAADYNRLVLEILSQGGQAVDLNDPVPGRPGGLALGGGASSGTQRSTPRPVASQTARSGAGDTTHSAPEPVFTAASTPPVQQPPPTGAVAAPEPALAAASTPSVQQLPPTGEPLDAQSAVPQVDISELGDPGSVLRGKWQASTATIAAVPIPAVPTALGTPPGQPVEPYSLPDEDDLAGLPDPDLIDETQTPVVTYQPPELVPSAPHRSRGAATGLQPKPAAEMAMTA